jgi:hypothetical protein
MSSTDLVAAPYEDSALKSLLRKATGYEKAGAVIPGGLMQFGLLGSTLIIATGLLALILPGATSIRRSGFYLVLGGPTASLGSIMGHVAILALICGGSLLVIDAGLMQVRTSEYWRYVVVAQAVAGGIGGAFCTIFLALVILNLAIWIALFALGLMIIFMIIGAMAGG